MLLNCLNSHILKLSLHFLENVYELAVSKSYGFKNLVKLGRGRANFKNTLEERPSECSNSFFELENDKVKKVSLLFHQVNLFLVFNYKIYQVWSASLLWVLNLDMKILDRWFKNRLEERLFSYNQFIKEFSYDFEYGRASPTKQKI